MCRELELAPDEDGAVELLEMFWDPDVLGKLRGEGAQGEEQEPSRSVPPILAYEDLRGRLAEEHGFEKGPEKQRLRSLEGTPLDLVPLGGGSSA